MRARATATKILCVLLIAATWMASAAAADSRITGTYSTLYLTKIGRDLTGIEVRIVRTDKGYKAVVQVAEGGAGDIYIVNVQVNENRVAFDIPYTMDVRGHFSGRVSAAGLVGVVVYPNGESETTTLPRTVSYWER